MSDAISSTATSFETVASGSAEGAARAAALQWTNKRAGDKPTLARLTGESLTLAKVPPADLEPVAAAIERGETAPGEVIPLSTIVGASGMDNDAELTVAFKVGASQEEKRPLKFVDRAHRDSFVEALAGVLGPPFAVARRPVSRWVAGAYTLGPTIAVGVAFYLMSLEAQRIAAGQPPANWGRGKLRLLALIAHWLEDALGPTGLLISGAVLVVIGLGIFAMLMASPPMKVFVEKQE